MFLYLLIFILNSNITCQTNPTLNTLALEYCAQKNSTMHNYAEHYTRYLEPLRDQPIVFLEINSIHASFFSAQMWDKYFTHPDAKLIFASNNQRFFNHTSQLSKRCILWTINPENPEHCKQLQQYQPFDVIISADTHSSLSHTTIFNILFSSLKPNGVYAIEGLYTSYPKTIPYAECLGVSKKNDLNSTYDPVLTPIKTNPVVHEQAHSMMRALKNSIDEINNPIVQSPLNFDDQYYALTFDQYEKQWPSLICEEDKAIESIYFYQNICIIKKKELNKSLNNTTYPIQFSIPSSKIVSTIPTKTKDFAHIVPGDFNTYIYSDEQSYYKGYQEAYYGITCAKIGWDCMRHYEIIANGCIPYFINLEQCHPNTMQFLPKKLILEAMHLPGVSYQKIDHSIFDKKRYYEILQKILNHMRQYLTSKAMAEYVLQRIGYKNSQKILYLYSTRCLYEYMRDLTLIGLRESIGNLVTEYPKDSVIYTSYPDDTTKLYGRGFSYTKILPDIDIDRSNIAERIKAKEFDYIFYVDIHKELPFYSLVKQYYTDEQIVYLCGSERHTGSPFTHYCGYKGQVKNLFLREWPSDMLYNQ